MLLENTGVSRVSKGSVNVLQENFNKKFQGCFKNVSMKFCFAIVFSHVSHRSYPSRRRACYSMNVLSDTRPSVHHISYSR